MTDIRREDLQRQLDVHYLGAVLAIGVLAARDAAPGAGRLDHVLGLEGGARPGSRRGAYGGSKAALLQAMRVAAVELGGDGIRVNAINADQVETPMFMRFVEERAAMRGVSVEDQLEAYRRRNVMGVSLIPAERWPIIADPIRERPVPLHHGRHHHHRRRPARRVSPLTAFPAR